MDCAVSFLRRIARRDIVIASSFFSPLIRGTRGTSWNNIGRLFQSSLAINREDGFYIIPSFTGLEEFGHWYAIIVVIRSGKAVGYSLDSLGTRYSRKKSEVRMNIMTGFGITHLRDWIDIPIMLQTEVECGARCIWNMVVICIASSHHIPLHNIFSRLRTLGGISRQDSAERVREDVTRILSTQSGAFLFS